MSRSYPEDAASGWVQSATDRRRSITASAPWISFLGRQCLGTAYSRGEARRCRTLPRSSPWNSLKIALRRWGPLVLSPALKPLRRFGLLRATKFCRLRQPLDPSFPRRSPCPLARSSLLSWQALGGRTGRQLWRNSSTLRWWPKKVLHLDWRRRVLRGATATLSCASHRSSETLLHDCTAWGWWTIL